MKKILSLLLALLLLGSAAAYAESATLYAFSDPVLDIQMGEESLHLDLTGLSFAVAPVTVGEEEVYVFNVLGDGTPLLAAAFRLEGERMLVDMDGWSKTYYAAIPNVAGESGTAGPALPDVDLTSLGMLLMSQMQVELEGDTLSFVLPYTAVNALMQQLLPAILESTEIPVGLDIDAIVETFAELEESDSGLTISGSMTQNDSGIYATVNLFLVDAGETSEAPVAIAQFEMSDVLVLDVLTDGLSIHVGLASESGKLDFSFETEEQTVSLTGVFGTLEGEAAVPALGDAADAVNIEELTEEETQTLGMETLIAANDLLNYIAPILNALM